MVFNSVLAFITAHDKFILTAHETPDGDAVGSEYAMMLALRQLGKVARIFNTYGPRMHPHDGRVVSNFIIQALNNEPLTIYGDGSQTRSFCYVDDLIEVFIRFMNSSDKLVGPINIGNPKEISILQLAEKIIELTGSDSEITSKPLPSDDPKQRQPDISLAQEKLGWTPNIPLEEGLKHTIAYFDSLLKESKDG